jgi:hypothetical protein
VPKQIWPACVAHLLSWAAVNRSPRPYIPRRLPPQSSAPASPPDDLAPAPTPPSLRCRGPPPHSWAFSHDPTPGAHAVVSEVQGPDAAGAGAATAAAGPGPPAAGPRNVAAGPGAASTPQQVHGMLQQAQRLPRRRSRSTVWVVVITILFI